MGTGHVKAIVDIMKERNIPSYTDDDYYCIGWPTTFRTFKNELEAINEEEDELLADQQTDDAVDNERNVVVEV